MDISIVIVNWNAEYYLQKCLASLAAVPRSRSIEILVVDNASTDGSADMVKANFPHVKLIRCDQNTGFAKANNLAIQESNGRYITLMNPDVEIIPGCLDALADYLDQNPQAGNVGPLVLNPDMTLQSSCRKFPTLWNNFCSATGLATIFKSWRFFSGEHMLYSSHDRTAAVDVLVGCFWMMRREAVEVVGPLDEDFFLYGEDLDWCRRCWKAGWQVIFFPGAQVIHYRGASSATEPVRFAVIQQRSILRYWHKHHGLFGVLGIQILLFCHHALRYVFAAGSRLVRSSKTARTAARLQTTKACLQALFVERIPHKT